MNYQENYIINQRYRLVEAIGRGSFGEVWMATDLMLGINVAIKIYIALDSRGLDEFKSEFKNVYNLHHPNLLRADHFDNVGNNPYLVMPYCPASVGSMIGTFDEAELWKFIEDVASGLAYLHENDIIHRDIKPDNILRDSQNNYVITDFGLSTKMRSTLRRASARQVDDTHNQSGTIGYMAPEMFSAKPQAVKATDIWALGAAIYEIATGEIPFCGQGGVMELHGAELPKLPAKYSKALESIMVKCLSKEPWDRPTAKDILGLVSLHKRDNNGNPRTMDYDAYINEVSTLKKIIEKEKANYEQLRTKTDDQAKIKTSKNVKVFAWLSCAVSIILLIICIVLGNEYHSTRSSLIDIKTELNTTEELNKKYIQILEQIMQDAPVLASNIDVKGSGSYGETIYNSNTTYVYTKATLISNCEISNKKLYIKMYKNGVLFTGNTSPSGYSYSADISLNKHEPKEICFDGWGYETKGMWGAGTHRVELWYDGKCIGSKTFTIK